LEIAAKTLFDVDVATQAAEVGEVLGVVMEENTALRGVLRLPRLFPSPGDRRLRRAVRRLDEIIDAIIRERRASGRDTGDLLSMLLNAQDIDGTRMTNRQLRDEAVTIIIAGHETTALALSWTWYLLSQHPAVEARLIEELQAVLAGRPPEVEDLPKLRYAEQIFQEALRLYPPVWGTTRIGLRDCEIGGYPVKAGTSLAVCPWVMHRDPRYFEDPDAFRPERWEDGLEKRLPRFAYFPFLGGPRLCIGKAFALMEGVLLLARIAQQFRLTLAPGQTVTPWATLTLRPKDGIRMQLTRR
jgi:cytochrome P450